MLSRPKNGRVVAGVCAGLARRFDISPTAMRLIAVVGVVFVGLPVVVYIILWIVMPSDDY